MLLSFLKDEEMLTQEGLAGLYSNGGWSGQGLYLCVLILYIVPFPSEPYTSVGAMVNSCWWVLLNQPGVLYCS